MHFLDQKLENKKNGEQLKHRNIRNEILWTYGNFSFLGDSNENYMTIKIS